MRSSTDGLVTFPGLPGPRSGQHLTFEESASHHADGTRFCIGRIDMVGSTGTYLGTPSHRFPDGYDLSALPLRRGADLPAPVVDATGAIGVEVLEPLDTLEVTGAAVLFRTGWDVHWGVRNAAVSA